MKTTMWIMADREHLQLRLTVDLAILTVRDGRLQVLVIERGNDPFQGQDALPGGFLRAGEDLREAAVRELAEETSLDGDALHLEQLAAFAAPDRDPRGRVVSVAFLAIAPNLPRPAAGSDALSARWAPVDEVHDKLAFDHGQILGEAVERARSELELTTLAAAFCGPTFTIGDLRTVYEVVWNTLLDPRNFARKVANTDGFVEPTGQRRVPETGRPAALYRRGPAQKLNPPLMRNSAAASLAAAIARGPGHRHAGRGARVTDLRPHRQGDDLAANFRARARVMRQHGPGPAKRVDASARTAGTGPVRCPLPRAGIGLLLPRRRHERRKERDLWLTRLRICMCTRSFPCWTARPRSHR